MNRHTWSGSFQLSQPPQRAFVAFTARGEFDWVPGWNASFYGPAEDDTAPGTVFVTTHSGETIIWEVIDSCPPEYLRYSRVTPGASAGTLTVELEPTLLDSGEAGSQVTVTYALTALSEAAEAELSRRAGDPHDTPAAWREPVEAYLAGRATPAQR